MRPLAGATPAGHGLDHLGFDGEVRDGMLVVHKRAPPEVVEIFRELFNAMFRIEEMQSYETYPIGEYAEQEPTVSFTVALLRTTRAPSAGTPMAWLLTLTRGPIPTKTRRKDWWPKLSSHTITLNSFSSPCNLRVRTSRLFFGSPCLSLTVANPRPE
jgi:hypothetical protein